MTKFIHSSTELVNAKQNQTLCWADQSTHPMTPKNKSLQSHHQDNNTSGINTDIKVNGQKLETVTSFKYLGSVIIDEGPKPEILSRIAQTTAALTRLKPVWIDKSISLSSKIRLMRSLVTSISCMLVNHGPLQQSPKEEYKPWK